MGLIFGCCIIIDSVWGQIVASIRWSRFRVSLVLLPGLWHSSWKAVCCGQFGLHLTLEHSQWVSRWASHAQTIQQSIDSKTYRIDLKDIVALHLYCIKVTGYRKGAWFKNNFGKVFSPCNYYPGIATTSNALSFRSLWSKSALQKLVRSYHTQAQRYSRCTVQIFAASFLKLCASIRPVFLVYSPHKYCRRTDDSFFEYRSLSIFRVHKFSWNKYSR